MRENIRTAENDEKVTTTEKKKEIRKGNGDIEIE